MSDVAYGCVGFGILLVIGGFIAYSYEVTTYLFTIPIPSYPYRDLGIPLISLGIVMIIVGAVLLSIKKPQAERMEERSALPSVKKCPKCGTEYPSAYIYCPKCKEKLLHIYKNSSERTD